jgi:hypothetical protein
MYKEIGTSKKRIGLLPYNCILFERTGREKADTEKVETKVAGCVLKPQGPVYTLVHRASKLFPPIVVG